MQKSRIVRDVAKDPEGFEIFVHSHKGARAATIINIPGYQGDIAGYNNKYITLGNDLAERGFAFVRMPNITRPAGTEYAQGLVQDMRAVIESVIWNIGWKSICLMGFSAGGYAAAFAAAENKVVVIKDCNHQFTGRRNGQIMAKAPLWAFAGEKTFPSPEGGLVLYD